MQKNSLVSEMLELSVDERIKIVGDLWDSIAEVPDAVKLTEEEKEILDERIQAYHENPDAGLHGKSLNIRLRLENESARHCSSGSGTIAIIDQIYNFFCMFS